MVGGLGGELEERQDVASGTRGSVVRVWAGNTLPGKSEVRARGEVTPGQGGRVVTGRSAK